MKKYRIVRDGWLGFEAQFKLWFLPWWLQCYVSNTSSTVEEARKIAQNHSLGLKMNGKPKNSHVVEYLQLN